MPDLSQKFRVLLSLSQRASLEAVLRQQSVGVAKARKARILLLSDENHPDGRRRDRDIAELVGLSERQVVRIRQQFVREGDAALERKPMPPRAGKLDGKAEAQLITICCSKAPKGCDRWTLQLLSDELCRLKIVKSISRETVRKYLKKTASSRGMKSGSASRKRTVRGS